MEYKIDRNRSTDVDSNNQKFRTVNFVMQHVDIVADGVLYNITHSFRFFLLFYTYDNLITFVTLVQEVRLLH